MSPGEGVQLLDTCDGDGVELLLSAVLVQGHVDLTGAKNYAVNLVGREDSAIVVSGVGDYPLEVRFAGELFNGGAREGMAEERFGEEED